jgi:hypothetical protein
VSKFDVPMLSTRGAASKPPEPPARRIGRPRATVKRPRGGRSGDKANFHPLTVYVPRDVHGAVLARLTRDGRQYSHLIETLLRAWLKKPDLA